MVHWRDHCFFLLLEFCKPPIFDPNADPAINYGAAGGVIGHEVNPMAFDDQGRKNRRLRRAARLVVARGCRDFLKGARRGLGQAILAIRNRCPGVKVKTAN